MSTEASFADEAAFTVAINDVRNDASDLTYVICGHVDGNPNLVDVVVTGSDVSEIGMKMDPTQALYGLARYETKFDMSTTVKFVYIHWLGDNIPFVKRGRYGVVQGSVEARFSPYHALVEASSPEDLDKDKILQELMEQSGTKSKVLAEETDLSSRQMRGFTQTQLPQRDKKAFSSVQEVSKKGASLDILPNVYEAITRVRGDDDPATWMVAGYNGGNPKGPLECVGVGEGTVDNLKSSLDESQPMYGLYRVTHPNSDDIMVVKFVYFIWVGPQVKTITKGKISTHKGAIEEIFAPFHVNLHVDELSEVDDVKIMDKIHQITGQK